MAGPKSFERLAPSLLCGTPRVGDGRGLVAPTPFEDLERATQLLLRKDLDLFAKRDPAQKTQDRGAKHKDDVQHEALAA